MEISTKEGLKGKGREGLFVNEVKLKSGNPVIIRFGFMWDGEDLTSVSGTITREVIRKTQTSSLRETHEIARFTYNTWYCNTRSIESELRQLVSDAYDKVREYFSEEKEN